MGKKFIGFQGNNHVRDTAFFMFACLRCKVHPWFARDLNAAAKFRYAVNQTGRNWMIYHFDKRGMAPPEHSAERRLRVAFLEIRERHKEEGRGLRATRPTGEFDQLEFLHLCSHMWDNATVIDNRGWYKYRPSWLEKGGLSVDDPKVQLFAECKNEAAEPMMVMMAIACTEPRAHKEEITNSAGKKKLIYEIMTSSPLVQVKFWDVLKTIDRSGMTQVRRMMQGLNPKPPQNSSIIKDKDHHGKVNNDQAIEDGDPVDLPLREDSGWGMSASRITAPGPARQNEAPPASHYQAAYSNRGTSPPFVPPGGPPQDRTGPPPPARPAAGPPQVHRPSPSPRPILDAPAPDPMMPFDHNNDDHLKRQCIKNTMAAMAEKLVMNPSDEREVLYRIPLNMKWVSWRKLIE